MGKIAIAGFGIEGEAAYDYYSDIARHSELDPESSVEIFDDKLDKYPNFSEIPEDYLIIRSPGINPNKLPAGRKVWSATNEFFAKCPAPIIGVTGTKGKGSTASFIAEILKTHFARHSGLDPESSPNVHLVGNIGVPALEVLGEIKPSDVVVYELSSFQLWDLQKSPHVAVLTIIEPDHLDVHASFAEYISAKENIVKFQTADDFVIYNHKNPFTVNIAQMSKGKKLEYPKSEMFKLAENGLPGVHNNDNAQAAILAFLAVAYPELLARHSELDSESSQSEATWIPDQARNDIIAGLGNFSGLPHRLKFVAEKNGVEYYDDSIATTPGSAIAAIRSFTRPKILILGGHDKGGDYTEIGEVSENGNVKEIFAIGGNRDKVASQVGEKYSGKITLLDIKNMDELVKKIAGSAEPGDIVILSPAAASFGLFKDYKDRGDQFIKAVNSL